jgi:hypothetical protein
MSERKRSWPDQSTVPAFAYRAETKEDAIQDSLCAGSYLQNVSRELLDGVCDVVVRVLFLKSQRSRV